MNTLSSAPLESRLERQLEQPSQETLVVMLQIKANVVFSDQWYSQLCLRCSNDTGISRRLDCSKCC